jgi:hypothetical protein
MNFNQAKIISVYYNKGDRKPYDVNGKPIAYIGEEFIGSTEATTIRFYLGEDIDSSTATIVTKRADGERRLDICTKVGSGVDSYYEVTLNEWYSYAKGKLVVVFKAYNGTVTFDDNENPTEITSVSGRIIVSDIFNLDIAYAPVADLVVPADDTDPYEDWFFALSTKLDKADSITVAGALPTLTGDVYDDRYFYIEDEGVGRLYYINGSTAEEVVFGVGTLKLTATGNGELTADTGKISWDEGFGGFEYIQYRDVANHIGQDVEFYGKAFGAITKGDVVQFHDVQGDHFLIKKAIPSQINANPKLIMGIAKQDLTNNEFGYVAHFGRIRGINTNAYDEGDFLWFASGGVVDGALTNTQPIAPNAKVLLAVVVDKANNGTILVRPTIEPKLEELQNVLITSATNGNVLSYDGTKWVNSTRLTTAETDIANIEDGTTIVAKANADKDGNEFDATYLKKASASSTYVPLSQKGATNGVATLGSDGRVPSSQLPASIGEIIEFPTIADFPEEGTAERIYIALDTNLAYRWSGTQYSEISPSIALGETSSTAFAGNRGVALETLTDNIVDGTQTLTNTRITNSATNVVPLIVNGIASTTSALQEWRNNGSNIASIATNGLFRTALGISNNLSANNSYLNLSSNGTIISRNVADANPSLIVNQANAGSTGDILRLQSAGANVLEITRTGGLNQNGTRLFHQTGFGSTFFGLQNGTLTNTGSSNTSFGNEAISALTSGNQNTAVGYRSLRFNSSGSNNVGIGLDSGRSITTGGNNTFLGTNAGFTNQLATASNSTAVGFEAYTDKSNQMVYGNASVTEHVFNRNTGATMLLPQTLVSSATFPALKTIRTTTATNALVIPMMSKTSTSNDMVDGFGSGISFAIEDNLNVENQIAQIGALRSGADNSGRIVFLPINAGTTTERMTILPDGKVGIGTSAPVNVLSVISPSNTDGIQIRRNSTTTNDYARLGFAITTSEQNANLVELRAVRTNRAVSGDTDLSFFTNSNATLGERLRIRDDGLVGINETSPTAQLQVKSGATNRIPLIVDTLASHTANLQEWRLNGSLVARVTSSGQLATPLIRNVANSANSLLELSNNGALISRNIADTNPALIVNLANASATGNIQVWQKSGVARATITNGGGATFSSFVDLQERLSINVTNSVQNEAIVISNSVEDLFYIDRTNGDVYNKNGTYGTISDLRLKENIVQARDYTEDIMKLNVVKYSFKKDHSETPTHLGFIAQEVEEVFPGLVETRKSKELDDQKQIKMSVLIPMLVKTIQEQQKQIDELKAKIG